MTGTGIAQKAALLKLVAQRLIGLAAEHLAKAEGPNAESDDTGSP
jgi:hypothetical protein